MNKPDGEHRWLRFSLRAMLLFTAIIAAWLAVQVNKAQKQRAAVAAIEEAGGTVTYDWEEAGFIFEGAVPPIVMRAAESSTPGWLSNAIGQEYFQEVVAVSVPEHEVTERLIDHLRCFSRLNLIIVSGPAKQGYDAIHAAFPDVEKWPPPSAVEKFR